MMRPTPVLLALAVGAVLLAGCGDDTATATTELAITGTDAMEFEPDTFTVAAGDEVTVEFTAEASVDHDLVIEGVASIGMAGEQGHGDHADEDHAMEGDDLHVAHADPGETVTATFMIEEAGTYEVYCSVPGHREAGMVATLTVVAD